MAKEKKFKHIVRVGNVDLPGEKQIRRALTNIKGLGINLADSICKVAKVNRVEKAGNLNDEDVNKLNDVLKDPKSAGIPAWMFNRRKDFDRNEDIHMISGDLGYAVENDIKREIKIQSLRGVRLQRGLTVRGQKTRSNFRHQKGKVVGVKKRGDK